MVIFMCGEITLDVCPTPLLIARYVCPVLIISRLATQIQHRINTRTTAEHLATGITQLPAIQTYIRFGLVHPVSALITNTVEIADRYMNPVVVILTTRFNQ